jgi:hypothetical protein
MLKILRLFERRSVFVMLKKSDYTMQNTALLEAQRCLQSVDVDVAETDVEEYLYSPRRNKQRRVQITLQSELRYRAKRCAEAQNLPFATFCSQAVYRFVQELEAAEHGKK